MRPQVCFSPELRSYQGPQLLLELLVALRVRGEGGGLLVLDSPPRLAVEDEEGDAHALLIDDALLRWAVAVLPDLDRAVLQGKKFPL